MLVSVARNEDSDDDGDGDGDGDREPDSDGETMTANGDPLALLLLARDAVMERVGLGLKPI